jgi:hypothetical protein
MKAALLSLMLAGCAQQHRHPEPPVCPPLPEIPVAATEAQRVNHYAVVIRLYTQCAGARTGDH